MQVSFEGQFTNASVIYKYEFSLFASTNVNYL